MKFTIRFKGGKGSGHHGHSGRPGMVGGSVGGKGVKPDYVESVNAPNNKTFIEALGGRPTEDDEHFYHITQATRLDNIRKIGLLPGGKAHTNFPGYVSNYVALAHEATKDRRGPEYVGGAGYYGRIIADQDWVAMGNKYRRPVMLRVAKDKVEYESSWRHDEVSAKKVDPDVLEMWEDGTWVPLL